jgi:hypothetical protein
MNNVTAKRKTLARKPKRRWRVNIKMAYGNWSMKG